MYRLRDLKNGSYQIHVANGTAFEGSLKAIVKKCVELRLRLPEVQEAIIELHRLNHDYAEFGVFGTFMYTMQDRKAA